MNNMSVEEWSFLQAPERSAQRDGDRSDGSLWNSSGQINCQLLSHTASFLPSVGNLIKRF